MNIQHNWKHRYWLSYKPCRKIKVFFPCYILCLCRIRGHDADSFWTCSMAQAKIPDNFKHILCTFTMLLSNRTLMDIFRNYSGQFKPSGLTVLSFWRPCFEKTMAKFQKITMLHSQSFHYSQVYSVQCCTSPFPPRHCYSIVKFNY